MTKPLPNQMDILLAGSISYDFIMRYAGKFSDLFVHQTLNHLRVNFTVDEMQQHHGGVSANIAYTMALLGGKPRLFGTVGADFAPYRRRLEMAGVDCSTIVTVEETVTAVFFANTDADNNQVGSFFAGAMGYAGRYGVLEVARTRPDLVVISPNAPAGMARHIEECRRHHLRYVFDPSQQVAILGAEVLRQGIDGCYALACNEYEWEVIQKQTGYTIDRLAQNGIIFIHTLGENGANLYLPDQLLHIPAYEPRQMVNPTGAGDAFRGGLLRGISLGLPWEVCGRMGALCGTYALEYYGTQEHDFSLVGFVNRYRQKWDDEGALDALLR